MIIPYKYFKTYRSDFGGGNTAILEFKSESPLNMVNSEIEQLDPRLQNKAVISVEVTTVQKFMGVPPPMDMAYLTSHRLWIENIDALQSLEHITMWPELLQHLNFAPNYVRDEHNEARLYFRALILRELQNTALSANLLCHESLEITVKVILTACVFEDELYQYDFNYDDSDNEDDDEEEYWNSDMEDNHGLSAESIEFYLSRWHPPLHINDAEEELCVVCLEAMGQESTLEEAWLPCHHGFHRDCIVMWLEIRGMCPTCRLEFD